MSGRSRILRLEDKISAAVSVPDRQADRLRDLEVADDAFVQAFNEHFKGTGVLEDREKIRAATILRNSIRRGAEKQLDAVVEMGRALLRAEQAFTRQEWSLLLEGGSRLIGLPKSTAAMYRAIARDIDGGRLPRTMLPESFSTAYVLTTYEDWRLKAAQVCGILRSTVTRKEVEEFKRLPADQIPGMEPQGRGQSVKISRSQEELHRLQEDERRLVRREARLLDELGKLQQQLSVLREKLVRRKG
jgi:hypothetical protein